MILCVVLPSKSAPEPKLYHFVSAMHKAVFVSTYGWLVMSHAIDFSGFVGDQRWHLLLCLGLLGEGAWTTTLEASACFAVKNSNKPMMLTVIRMGVAKRHETILVLCDLVGG